MKAILCEPGYQARYVDIENPVGGDFVREALTDSIEVIRNKHTSNLRPNRRYMDDEAAVPTHFYKGNILFVGIDGELSLVDRLFVMSHFLYPDFVYPIMLGLEEGDELMVVKGYEFMERTPDKVVVKKEFQHFISVEFIYEDRSYRSSLNKSLILCGDLVVWTDGKDLLQLMRNG